MWLKGVVMRAHYNGLIPKKPFAQFHINPNVKEREYLTEDEIKTIMSHEFKSSTLSLVRVRLFHGTQLCGYERTDNG